MVFLYGFIHFLEFLSFLSRVAGIITKAKITSYTLQQATFVGTRFLFVAMMPLIGIIVDMKIDKSHYLLMVHAALLVASLLYLIVIGLSHRIIIYFCGVIHSFQGNGSLVTSFFRPRLKDSLLQIDSDINIFSILRNAENKKLFMGAAVVFCCYSIGVFMSFYAALSFYEYRSSISQMSGVVNALATVLLTFYIEPKISLAIDGNNDNAKEKIYALLLGRFFGVAVISQILVMVLWLI